MRTFWTSQVVKTIHTLIQLPNTERRCVRSLQHDRSHEDCCGLFIRVWCCSTYDQLTKQKCVICVRTHTQGTEKNTNCHFLGFESLLHTVYYFTKHKTEMKLKIRCFSMKSCNITFNSAIKPFKYNKSGFRNFTMIIL